MKNLWILITASLFLIAGLILHFIFGNMFSAGDYCFNYFAAGDFAVGVFATGKFSVGIFSAGIFSVGIFSISIFNVGLYAAGLFIFGWKKSYPKWLNTKEEEVGA